MSRSGANANAPSLPARAACAVVAAPGWILLACWAAGRLLSDRWAWSQWLFWIPTLAAVVLAGTLFALASVIRRATRGSATRRLGPAPLVWIAVLLWMILWEWRGWAWAAAMVVGRPEPALTLIAWNASNARAPDLSAMIDAHRADVLILSNPPPGVSWPGVVRTLGPDASTARFGRAMVVSRDEIMRWGSVSLGMRGRMDGSRDSAWRDQGWAGFFEIDTTARLGRPIVVWIIDLPSDIAISRVAMTLLAAGAIHAWTGPMSVRTGGSITQEMADAGFPEPDVIVGDFNIPRGSWSLRVLTGSMHNAWSDAGTGGGVGPLGSWPRRWPIYHLDQAFLGRDLRSTSYRLVDPGQGRHRTQVVSIAPKK
ncbi:MAG: hypothetical protein IIB55_05920 [Planctomycetes bacterium]|nr:hypothetical protein [Planctomycetota bacterium]